MMKPLLFALLFLSGVSLQAQSFEKAVFFHKTRQQNRTLEVGDRLKVKYLKNGELVSAKGKLQKLENDVLYLVDQPGIPLYKVKSIRYRDPGLRGLLVSIFFIGCAILGFGLGIGIFALLFQTVLPIVTWSLWIGILLIFLAFIIQAIGTHHIRDAGTAWEVETVMKAAPVQTP